MQRYALDLIIFSSIAVIASLNIIFLYIEFRDGYTIFDIYEFNCFGAFLRILWNLKPCNLLVIVSVICEQIYFPITCTFNKVNTVLTLFCTLPKICNLFKKSNTKLLKKGCELGEVFKGNFYPIAWIFRLFLNRHWIITCFETTINSFSGLYHHLSNKKDYGKGWNKLHLIPFFLFLNNLIYFF